MLTTTNGKCSLYSFLCCYIYLLNLYELRFYHGIWGVNQGCLSSPIWTYLLKGFHNLSIYHVSQGWHQYNILAIYSRVEASKDSTVARVLKDCGLAQLLRINTRQVSRCVDPSSSFQNLSESEVLGWRGRSPTEAEMPEKVGAGGFAKGANESGFRIRVT